MPLLYFVWLQVVCKCCEIGDPGLTVQTLMGQVKEGAVSEEGLESLLYTVQEMAPTPSLRLSQLLEGRAGALDAGGNVSSRGVCLVCMLSRTVQCWSSIHSQ